MTTTGTKRIESTFLRQTFTLLAALLLTSALPAAAGHHEDKDAKNAVCSDRGHCEDCEHCQHHACSEESCPADHGKDGHGCKDGHHGCDHGMSHADGHGGAKSGHSDPSPEARAKMAAAHERLAACLRSTRPIGECHAEMKHHHGAAMGGKPEATGKPGPADRPEKSGKPEKAGKPAKATN